MFSFSVRSMLRACALSLTAFALLTAQTGFASGGDPAPRMSGNIYEPVQTPPTSQPPQTPAQRDATRPPNTGQPQTVPQTARPNPSDPTAPPVSGRPAPQSPPGTENVPRTTAPQTVAPELPATTTTTTGQTEENATETTTVEEPLFPSAQPRPVPPLPSLARVGVTTGETRPLSLNDAIRRALENNNDIEFARNDVRLAESVLRSLEGQYDAVFQFTPQYNKAIVPQPTTLGGANETGTVSRSEFSFDNAIVRRVNTGGGNYQFFFNNSRVTSSSSNELFRPSYGSSLGLSYTQPLWRDRSIDNARRGIRIQRKRLEQSDADFRRRTVEVIAQVQRAYWDLVFALRDEQNQIANVNLARENFRRTEASVAAGATAPLERAEIQTELSNRESALLLASQNVTVAENFLKSLILRDPLAPEWSVAITPTDQPAFDTKPVNLTDALTEARANRPELRRLRLEQDVNNIDLQFFRNQTKPRIDLRTTFSTTGLAGTPTVTLPTGGTTAQIPLIAGDPTTDASAFLLQQINTLRRLQPSLGTDADVPTIPLQSIGVASNFIGGYGRNLRNLFSLDTRNIVVGVTIEMPLRNRTAKANLATALIQRDQLAATTRGQDQVVEVEVRNAVQAVETARRRVLAARTARENAELQLAGERRLYQVGRTTTFLLFQRENQLVNARNLELRAETDYNKALAEFQRATSTTLRANNIIIETPVAP
ncbi:MAG TPA: TolC family protein [Pyrinomonadaceae bacterium]|jgi:HAE1 family hydrophobic/amphiphilic exporter-1